MKIYLSSPFFNDNEIKNMRKTQDILEKNGHKVFVPMDIQIPENLDEIERAKNIFYQDKVGIDECDAVVLLYYGIYSDSGTAWECGYAYAKNKPVIVVHCQNKEPNNLMITMGSFVNLPDIEALKTYDLHNPKQSMFYGHTTLS